MTHELFLTNETRGTGMKIANIIEPIKLLKGTHDHTASTGQGCFMNVIAYLNGEPQITDKSECVCFVVRPIAIWFNDFLLDSERHILIPFIERAMGSVTTDRAEIERRAHLAADMAKRMSDVAAKYAKYDKYAAEYANYAAKYAAESAAESANYAAESAAKSAKYAADYAAMREEIKSACLDFLDRALPKQEQGQVVVERAIRLREMVTV